LRLTEGQAKTLMASIACPILFIGASNSFKHVESVFDARKNWFKNAQYVGFEGGHHIHMEKTDEIGLLIQQFVE